MPPAGDIMMAPSAAAPNQPMEFARKRGCAACCSCFAPEIVDSLMLFSLLELGTTRITVRDGKDGGGLAANYRLRAFWHCAIDGELAAIANKNFPSDVTSIAGCQEDDTTGNFLCLAYAPQRNTAKMTARLGIENMRYQRRVDYAGSYGIDSDAIGC